jgi:hypothetical protein
MKYSVYLLAPTGGQPVSPNPLKIEADDVEIYECDQQTYWNFTNKDSITVAAIPFSNVFAILPNS